MRTTLAFFVLAGCGSVNNGSGPDAAAPHAVTVTVSGDGTGTVSSSPSGISCPTQCMASFTGEVDLVANATGGSMFVGWSGACSGTGACIITPTTDTSVTAMFAAPQQTLTVMKAGVGTGKVTSAPAGIDCGATCSAMFTAGSMITLTAAPDPGFAFKGWSGGGCAGVAPCVVTLTTATTVTATFSGAALFLIDDSNDSLYKITNLASPTLTLVGALGVQYEFGDCAYDLTGNKMYFVDGRPATPTKSLYTVNLTTGVATLVGAHGVTDMFALGYDPQNNTLYGVGLNAASQYTLYTLNTTTGAATPVGQTGYTNGLVWDTKRNHMVAITSSGSFNTIDLATGTQTAIAGAGPVLSNNNGIAYDSGDDLFWMATYSTNVGIEKFDPNNNYAGTAIATTGSHTCITYIPQ